LPRPWLGLGQSTGGAILMDYVLSKHTQKQQPMFERLFLLAPLVYPAKMQWLQLKLAFWWFKSVRTGLPRIFRQNTSDINFVRFMREEDPLQAHWIPVAWLLALKEWIEYHKIAGVDHFYLYNNESEDDYMEVLNSYIEDGTVTLIDWPYKQKQLESYCDCIKRFKDETRWLGFIDIDEFVVPIQDNDIYSFLKKYESNRPAVLLYWKIFGTGGLIDRNIEEPVTDSFHICWDKLYAVGKCFYNTSYDFDPGFFRNSIFHHHMWGQYNGKNLPPVNAYGKVSINQYSNPMKNEAIPIQINHYFTKSLSEYAEKKSKGDVFFKENPHDQEYMMAHENRCTSSDYSIYKYEMKLKDVLKKQHEKTFN